MQDITPLSPLSRFSRIIDALVLTVRERSGPCRFPPYVPPIKDLLIWVIIYRVQRVRARLTALVALLQAGRLRPPTLRTKPQAPRARTTKPPLPLHLRIGTIVPGLFVPRNFAWLLPMIPCHAACHANHLRLLLAEPEMQSLLAATPRAAKILRPLCRMLGVEPELLAPPPNLVGRSGQRFQLAPLGQLESSRRGISEAQSAVATLIHTAPSHPTPAQPPDCPPAIVPHQGAPPYFWPWIPGYPPGI